MTITYHREIRQNTEEWFQARMGILTASEVSKLFTKSFAPSKGKEPETLMYRKLAERINGWSEDSFMSWDMERGHFEEELALDKYNKEIADVELCGFIVNDDLGFPLGFSPDALVGDDGVIEVKSSKHEIHLRRIFENMIDADDMPDEHKIQVQSGLFVSGREWFDFIDYSNGMPMAIMRVGRDESLIEKIKAEATKFEEKLQKAMNGYNIALKAMPHKLRPTERNDYAPDKMEF